MNTNTATFPKIASETSELYYVGGVAAEISEKDLSSFFSQYSTVETLIIYRPKGPAKVGYSFLATTACCDLISKIGANPEVLGRTVTLELASGSTKKLMESQSRKSRKLFIGNIPLSMTSDQILSAISAHGPVERLMSFKVKSDRTKYCYAIMQHLEDATSIASLKTLKVTDPTCKSLEYFLQLGLFSQNTSQYENQTTQVSEVPGQKISSGGGPNRPQQMISKQEHPEIVLSCLQPWLEPQKALKVREVGNKLTETRDKSEYRHIIRTCVALSVHHRHELENIRFNILLD